MKQRVQASVRAGGRPAIDGSVMKVLWSEARRERAELGVALLGAGGALRDEWPLQLLEQFSGTIGGGTSEVHRTMIGERVLGLPPEPRVDRDVSYRELAGAPWLTNRSRTASTTTPIRSRASRIGCACSRASPTAAPAGALDRHRHRAGLALLRRRFGRGHDRGLDGRTGRARPGGSSRSTSTRASNRRARASSRCARSTSRSEPIGDDEFDVVHARGVLQHLAQREAVLDAMIAAAKPGGWIVVGDVDWIQFDAQPVPEPFATLSRDPARAQRAAARIRRHVGPDAASTRSRRAGSTEVDGRGEVWTMHGGTDSAEWYVAALERALDVLPAEVFPAGFDPRAAIAQAREPDFAILSPISVTAIGRKPVSRARRAPHR